MFHQSISSIYRYRARSVMQTSGTMSCSPAERAAELEVEAGGQPVESESCGLIIESQGHDRIKAHEKQSIIGMYLDLT
jgi:hypothetical protein